MLILYQIRHDNSDGDNLDLLVWAKGPEGAIGLWRQHYELDEDHEDPDAVNIIPHEMPACPMAICWSRIKPA